MIQSLVIEPAMERIGRLWEANAITVARRAPRVARAHLGTGEGEALDDVLRRAALAVSTLAARLTAERLTVSAADGQ